jgi:hypothetical protein
MENKVGTGLRSLLRYRVPEAEVEPTARRILDAVAADIPDNMTDAELVERVRQTMNAIAPRPKEPISRASSPNAIRKIRAVLAQCSGQEREIINRRYEGSQTIEQVAVGLHVGENEVGRVLGRVKERILFLIQKE